MPNHYHTSRACSLFKENQDCFVDDATRRKSVLKRHSKSISHGMNDVVCFFVYRIDLDVDILFFPTCLMQAA